MRPVVLYVTASLDGFIAEPGGGMGWLDAANIAETDFGYQPIVPGDGVPMLPPPHERRTLELTATRIWPVGVVELAYRVINKA